MTAYPPHPPAVVIPAETRRSFLALLPAIEAAARAAFRGVRCPHDRDDAVAEVVARAWEGVATGAAPAELADLAGTAVAAVRDELAARTA